jgi:hypothetical protein
VFLEVGRAGVVGDVVLQLGVGIGYAVCKEDLVFWMFEGVVEAESVHILQICFLVYYVVA